MQPRKHEATKKTLSKDSMSSWLRGCICLSGESRGPAMMGRLLVRVGETEQLPVRPQAAEKRDADRVAAADESRRNGDLRQAGHRALFAGARFAAVSLQPAFVGVRPRLVGRKKQRVEPL